MKNKQNEMVKMYYTMSRIAAKDAAEETNQSPKNISREGVVFVPRGSSHLLNGQPYKTDDYDRVFRWGIDEWRKSTITASEMKSRGLVLRTSSNSFDI